MRHINWAQRTKLSAHEQILFDAVRELQPHTEADWSKVNAKWTRDIWRKVLNSYLPLGWAKLIVFRLWNNLEMPSNQAALLYSSWRGLTLSPIGRRPAIRDLRNSVSQSIAWLDEESNWCFQVSDSTNRVQPNTGEEEGKKRVEPEDIIQFQNLFIEVGMRIPFRQQDCNTGQGPPKWTGTYMLHAARRTGDQGQGKLEEGEKEVEQHLRAMSRCFPCLSLEDVTLTNETSNGN